MNDSHKQHLCRHFLIAPSREVVAAVAQHVNEDSVDAVVTALKSHPQPHAWEFDMTPLLLGNCIAIPDFYPPTLQSDAERTALTSAYDGLADETKWMLANYPHTDAITAEKIERETQARATFIEAACAAICQLYGSGHQPILNTAKNALYRYPRLRSTHEPEDLLQIALEKLFVNFPKIVPISYRGYIIRTMKTYLRDKDRVEGRSPITTDPPESDVIAMPRQLPPDSAAIIGEALQELKTALEAYFDTLKSETYRSRFKKVALLLLYELDTDASHASQDNIAAILGCSPNSVLAWRKQYLSELPSIFKVLTQIW